MSDDVKIPLALATLQYSELLQQLEGGWDIDESLDVILDASRKDFQGAIQRRLNFFQVLESQIEMAKHAEAKWKEKKKQLESILERAEKKVIGIMQGASENVEFIAPIKHTSEIGGFKLSENPLHLDLAFETRSKSLSNVIDAKTIEAHNIPQEFVDEVSLLTLRAGDVLKALKTGGQFSWASASRNKKLTWGAVL